MEAVEIVIMAAVPFLVLFVVVRALFHAGKTAYRCVNHPLQRIRKAPSLQDSEPHDSGIPQFSRTTDFPRDEITELRAPRITSTGKDQRPQPVRTPAKASRSSASRPNVHPAEEIPPELDPDYAFSVMEDQNRNDWQDF